MDTMLFFRNTSDDSVVFPLSKLAFIDAHDGDKVILYFGETPGVSTQNLQNVAVGCADGNESALAKKLGELFSAHPHKQGMLVVADDIDSVFIDPLATSCGDITLDVNPAA
jgi:hypothetical protein